jgi:iron complex outermembrane recepter protein
VHKDTKFQLTYCLSWCLLAGVIQAQESTDTLEEIVVTGAREDGYLINRTSTLGFDLELKELPATVNIISSDFLRDAKVDKIIDVLAYVPGLSTSYYSFTPGDRVVSRGFEGTILLNGVRQVGESLTNRPPILLERVEFVKGPAGPEVGIASPGGSANFVTKKPRDVFAASVDAVAGSFGRYGVSGDVTGSVFEKDNLHFRIITSYQQDSEWRRGRPDTTPFWTVAPSIQWQYTDGGILTFEYERTGQDNASDYGVIFIRGAGFEDDFAPRTWAINSPDDSRAVDVKRYELTLTQRITEGLSFELQGQRFVQSQDGRYIGEPFDFPYIPGTLNFDAAGTFNDTSLFPEFAYRSLDRIATQNVQASFKNELELGDTRHALRLGFSYTRQNGTNEFLGIPTSNTYDLFDPDASQPIFEIGPPESFGAGIDTTQYKGVFAQWQADWSSRFRTVIGLRQDRFRETNVDFLEDGSFDQEQGYRDTVESIRVASSFDLTEALSLFAGYADAAQPQSGIFRDFTPVDALEGESIEVGLKMDLMGGRALLTTAAYQVTQNNIQECDRDPTLPIDDIENCTFAVLIGEVRIRGIETEIQGKLTNAFGLTGGLAIADSEVTRNTEGLLGKEFTNFPDKQASLFANYDWSDRGMQGLTTRLGAVYVGDRQGDAQNRFVLPAYTRIDIGAEYQVNDNLSIDLFVENLTDEYYFLNSPPFGDGQFIVPGVRRIFEIGARYNF